MEPSPDTGGSSLAASAVPLVRSRIADQIIQQLQTQIATGVLPRGGRLPTERELARAFNVSTPTVREAVRVLSSMGLVEVRQGSGAYVANDSQALLDASLTMLVQWENVSLADLLHLLRVLDLHMVAERAVREATEEDVQAVHEAALATARCTSAEEVPVRLNAFIVALVRCAHQPLLDALCGFLMRMVVSLELAAAPDSTDAYWINWASETSTYRLAIAEALRARDLELLIDRIAALHDRIDERNFSRSVEATVTR